MVARIFSRLSTSIYTFRQAVEPDLRRHPYDNIGSRSPSSRYAPYDFFPLLYLHFKIFLKLWNLTSNVTPTRTSDPDPPPRRTYPMTFSRLSTSILTFREAVEPTLQRHPYTNNGFVFPSSPYLFNDFLPTVCLHLKFS